MIDRHSLNSEINLGTYKVNFLDQDGRTFSEGEVTASQIFQPKQNLVFRLIRGKFKLRDESISPFALLNIDRCTFIDLDKTVDIAITNIQLGKEFDASFIILKTPLSFDSGNRLKLVNFNLVNFNKEVHKSEFEFDGWKVRLDRIANEDQYKQLPDIGGYLITHKGKFVRKDGSEFEINDANLVTSFLYNLFSFCKGVSTPAFLVEGLDSNNDLAWYEIGSYPLRAWKDCHNWFLDSRIDINSFADGFYHFSNEEPYKNYFNEVNYWYSLANGSLDNYTGVIIAHTALELMSWLYLIEDKKVLSVNGFNNLPAGDLFALTLEYCSIPINVQDELNNLIKLGKANNLNGPLLFSTIRNKIVHPPSKRRDEFTNDGTTIFEAKLLGIWYLELFILSKSKLEGKYVNILKYKGYRGETELLPWSKNA